MELWSQESSSPPAVVLSTTEVKDWHGWAVPFNPIKSPVWKIQ